MAMRARARCGAPISLLLSALAGSAAAQDAGAGEPWDPQRLIEEALSAAPPAVAEVATVEEWDGTVLKEGGADWVCLPTPPPARGAGTGPMCLDREWQALINAYVNQDESYRPTQVGISYMLAGDVGTSNTDPFATAPTADNQWVVEGPHLMIILPDRAQLAAFPTDHHHGGPYVMWPDTPFAHVMIPTDERPEQPVAAAPAPDGGQAPAVQ